MKSRVLKRIAAGVILVVLVAGTGLFLCRGALLRHVAGKKLEMLGQNYGLQIAYRELTMPSLSTVRLEGLTVVPEDRDTLLNLNKVEVDLSLLSLLGGKISVRQVDVEGMTLSFVKEGGISNYDFLFRQKDGEKDDSETETNALGGYDVRVKQTLHLIFRMLPENGELHNLKVTARRDSLQTRFLIPELILTNSQFASAIQVEEGAMQREWKVRGTLARSMRLIEGSIASADEDEKVMLPYIRPHYNATVEFDSIAFKLSELSSASAPLTLEGMASVDGLEVYHAALSPDTIDLDQGKLEYTCHVGDNYFELDSASTVIFNRLNFHPYLRAEKDRKWHYTASIHRPAFPAEDLFASLPKGLFRHVQGIRTSGKLSYDLLLDVNFNHLDSLKFSSDLRGHGFRIESLGGSELTKMNGEFEYTAYENDRPVRTFFIGPSNPNFRPLDRISPLLQMAIMQSEDGGFYYHQGFLPGAIQEALAYDLEVGRFARGGSTITMQLVKNVFLNRHKNIARKLEEALIVWLIENQHLTSKERMYEVYLNLVEWGPLVYGACEASHFYFDKEPSDLTVEEAIFLASIVPKPKHFRSVFNADATLRENQEGYFHLIARRLCAKGLLTEEEAAAVRPEITVKGKAKDMILYPDSIW